MLNKRRTEGEPLTETPHHKEVVSEILVDPNEVKDGKDGKAEKDGVICIGPAGVTLGWIMEAAEKGFRKSELAFGRTDNIAGVYLKRRPCGNWK